MSDGINFTSFFLYTRPSLRQPTAPVTCNVALGTGLSDACCPNHCTHQIWYISISIYFILQDSFFQKKHSLYFSKTKTSVCAMNMIVSYITSVTCPYFNFQGINKTMCKLTLDENGERTPS